VAGARGRRPGSGTRGSGTREAIEAAAKRQFAERGYPGTTLRSIAAEAGVDLRLVTYFFGTKQELFVRVVELPFEPAMYAELAAPGREGLGRRLAALVLTMLDSESVRQVLTGLVRAAASEEAAAVLVRQLLVTRMLGPLAEVLGGPDPELRASLMGSQIAGLVLARHVVGLPRLAEVPTDVLVAAIGPVFEHYLTVSLGPLPAAGA